MVLGAPSCAGAIVLKPHCARGFLEVAFCVVRKEEQDNPPDREQATDKAGRQADDGPGQRTALAETSPDLLGWGWGDGQVRPAVIPSLVDALIRGADIAKVRRVSRRDGWKRRFVTRTYARLNHALGTRSPDVNGCPKLMHRAVFEAAQLESTDWFLDPELLLLAEARGWNVVELPAAMEPRAGGQSKVNWRTAMSLGVQVCGWHLRNRG